FDRAEIRRRLILAKLYRRLGAPNSARAMPLLEGTRAMAGGQVLSALRAEIDVFRGQLQAEAKNFDLAERTFRTAQQSARNAGDEYVEAIATNNLGLLQQRRSRCDESTVYFDQAIAVW